MVISNKKRAQFTIREQDLSTFLKKQNRARSLTFKKKIGL